MISGWGLQVGEGLHRLHPEFQNLPSCTIALTGQGSRGPSPSGQEVVCFLGWDSTALDTR